MQVHVMYEGRKMYVLWSRCVCSSPYATLINTQCWQLTYSHNQTLYNYVIVILSISYIYSLFTTTSKHIYNCHSYLIDLCRDFLHLQLIYNHNQTYLQLYQTYHIHIGIPYICSLPIDICLKPFCSNSVAYLQLQSSIMCVVYLVYSACLSAVTNVLHLHITPLSYCAEDYLIQTVLIVHQFYSNRYLPITRVIRV